MAEWDSKTWDAGAEWKDSSAGGDQWKSQGEADTTWSADDKGGSSGDKWAADTWSTSEDKWAKAQEDPKSEAAAAWGVAVPTAEAAPVEATAGWGSSAAGAESSQWGGGGAQNDGGGAAQPSWGAAASAAASATGQEAGSWGNNSWAVTSTSAAPQSNAREFHSHQDWNKQKGIVPKKQDWELEADDSALFMSRLGSNAGIDFDRYDSIPVDVSGNKAEKIPVLSSFEDIYREFEEVIPESLMDNIRRCKYQKPTPVQKYAVPVGLVGRDVMCCAQTGSGKTAAFLIPIIGRMLRMHENPVGGMEVPYDGACRPHTLIMTPTRELCIQIFEEALKFCHRTPYRCCRVYGGEQTKIQMQELAKGVDLLVACPGRLLDFIGRDIIAVDKVQLLVLDEADRMLDMGFERSIRDIVENYGMSRQDTRQTMMFSATFPEPCQRMAQDYLYDYIWIGVGTVGGAVDTVTQRLVKVKPIDKYDELVKQLDEFYLNRPENGRCLVFVNAKDTARWLDEQLYEKQMDTGALHGDLTQEEREKNLRRFRNGEIDVMVATDVAARGLDIENVSFVINYDMAQDVDTYVHRIGRSGRIGNRGQALTFVAVDDSGDMSLENKDVLKKLQGIMQDAKSDIPEWLESVLEGYVAPATWNNWSQDNKDMRGTEWWSK